MRTLKFHLLLLLFCGVHLFAQNSPSPTEPKAQPPVADSKNAKDAAPPSQSEQGAPERGGIEALSDTMGVDFGPYNERVLHDVKHNWYKLIPESAKAPLMKKGNVAIEFAILKDGSVAGMKLVYSSGDVALDRAAWGGITDSNPFPPLPSEFGGQYLALRFKFVYNPSKVAPAKPEVVPAMDKGLVEGRTYKNVSIGLEFTPAPRLKLGTPESKGAPGTVPLLVTVSAWGEQESFSAREGTVFYADALAYYPEGQRSTEAYMGKVVRGNQKEGFEPVEGSVEGKLGGVSFARTDFKKGFVYEAVLVKACASQALVFIFTGSDRDAVNRSIGATDLKLDCTKK